MSTEASPAARIPLAEADKLREGNHTQPHAVLGAHPCDDGVVVRAFHPQAARCLCLFEGGELELSNLGRGLFGGVLAGASLPLSYRLRYVTAGGTQWERDDPYRFLPTVSDVDEHLFNEGTHRRLWEALGARVLEVDGVSGTAFAVWAPSAARVSVVGDFCGWDGRVFPMRSLGSSGLWELFLPGVDAGALYKYELKDASGRVALKADPLARAMQLPPETASVVTRSSYTWGDEAWMTARPERDPVRLPMAVYELHLGSWARDGERFLTYRELAPRLVEHVQRYGFTHVELLPVSEHPYYPSWGYQVSAYFAPTARYGSPDDLRYLVDTLHQAGIGVIVDWVPAHFPRDTFALARFDGTALYEHADPRQGEHPDWGTLIFNFGRHEVRSFLVSNALYWLEELHVDGLRVDAVASMLYLDYSREEGEWLPNEHGGRENLAAMSLLRAFNDAVREQAPGCFTVAEESTSWAGVTSATAVGGLGFTFKWNMGWMHDTLSYFARDPIHRGHHQDELTFAMIYEQSERFVMPLSHDEVVHLKKSLLEKMPGDFWQKLANLRLLYTYMWTRPGKKLLFMGAELATSHEWNHETQLEWHLQDDPQRAGVGRCLEALGALYHAHPCLWRGDHDPGQSFRWIDCNDRERSILVYEREDGDDRLLVALNLTPVPREVYRVGVTGSGTYRRVFDSDDAAFGGSEAYTDAEVTSEPIPHHGQPHSVLLRLPPLGAVVYAPA
jgi:1,4-alpha-glucan branching enzyme